MAMLITTVPLGDQLGYAWPPLMLLKFDSKRLLRDKLCLVRNAWAVETSCHRGTLGVYQDVRSMLSRSGQVQFCPESATCKCSLASYSRGQGECIFVAE